MTEKIAVLLLLLSVCSYLQEFWFGYKVLKYRLAAKQSHRDENMQREVHFQDFLTFFLCIVCVFVLLFYCRSRE